MNTQPITLQLPLELLAQAQAIAGSPEDLQNFLIQAIGHEIERHPQPSVQKGFSESLEEFRQDYDLEKANINPDEVFSDVRDRSPGREVTF